MRFNNGQLGAWYAGLALKTSIAEVAHHLRREAGFRRLSEMRIQYRSYTARLAGDYVDIRNAQTTKPELYVPNDYSASQAFGEGIRMAGGSGIVYASLRHQSGTNVAAFRPRDILDVMQAAHYEITAPVTGKVIARTLRDAVRLEKSSEHCALHYVFRICASGAPASGCCHRQGYRAHFRRFRKVLTALNTSHIGELIERHSIKRLTSRQPRETGIAGIADRKDPCRLGCGPGGYRRIQYSIGPARSSTTTRRPAGSSPSMVSGCTILRRARDRLSYSSTATSSRRRTSC